ncbi:MAG TPA: hypothetical protein VF585_10440 [Chthoniobacterales bacterium]|jgi:hypothetical protein
MAPEASSPDPRRVIPSGASKREIIIAVLGALLLIALVGYAVMNMGGQSAENAITGKVVSKRFEPRPETQLTIGQGGVQRNDLAGRYFISVKAASTGELYNVVLSEEDYQRVDVGDTYQIPKASLVP